MSGPIQLAIDNTLAADLAAFLGSFISYPDEHAATAHLLWIAHTHAMEAWSSTPRIAFLSPEPGSGKSRALEITETLVPNPLNAFSATPAFLFRKVGDTNSRPTILLDEVDAIFGPKAGDHEDLRALLNSGHRPHAMVGRCETRGRTIVTKQWPVYAAVALAGLGTLPDTLLSRSIVIRMRRRGAGDRVTPYRPRDHEAEGHALRDRLASWIEQRIPRLQAARPCLPPSIQDRAADCWECLVAIADAFGRPWSTRARAAAIAMVAASKRESPSVGLMLLNDLRQVFGEYSALTTEEILNRLRALPESPWAEYRGKGLTPYPMSQLLKDYDVRPRTVRIGTNVNQRGYVRAELADAWGRYLAPLSGQKSATSAASATDTLNSPSDVAGVADVAGIREHGGERDRDRARPNWKPRHPLPDVPGYRARQETDL